MGSDKYLKRIKNAFTFFVSELADINAIIRYGKRKTLGFRISVAYKNPDIHTQRSDYESLTDEKENFFLLRNTPDQRANLWVILDAFASATLRRAKLIIAVSNENEVVELEQQVKSKNVTVVVCNNDELLDYLYLKARGFINCSLTEISRLTIIKAQESFCILVLSDTKVFRQLVGDNAAFFEPGSVPSATAAIWSVFKKKENRSESTVYKTISHPTLGIAWKA
jgi:hypothetical protein